MSKFCKRFLYKSENGGSGIWRHLWKCKKELWYEDKSWSTCSRTAGTGANPIGVLQISFLIRIWVQSISSKIAHAASQISSLACKSLSDLSNCCAKTNLRLRWLFENNIHISRLTKRPSLGQKERCLCHCNFPCTGAQPKCLVLENLAIRSSARGTSLPTEPSTASLSL